MLEEEFFKTFNIAKTSFDFTCNKKQCDKKRLSGRFACLRCDNKTKRELQIYPQITAERLLKLLCVVSHYEPLSNYQVTLEELKNNCLERLIELSDISWIKEQVQSLFEKGAEDG